MIFVFLTSFAIFVICLKSIEKQDNRLFIITSSVFFNIALIFFEQIYLETSLQRSFHFSDPSNYHEEIRHLSIEKLFDFITDEEYKSNQFYYIINWLYYQSITNSTILALTLKTTNLLIFYSAFILLTREQRTNRSIDFVLLFHPYLTMTLIRNVRDAYIIFFLSIFIYAMQSKKFSNSLKYASYVLSSLLMFTVRPFFTAIMVSLIAKNRLANKSKATIISILLLTSAIIVVMFYFNLFNINTKIFSAIFSTFSTHEGLDEERDEIVSELMEGNSADIGFWISTVKRLMIGAPVFLFTPNPINYTLKFYQEHTFGVWGIYTLVDNILIILGSIVNYTIIYPILLKTIFNIKKTQIEFAITAFIMFASYTIFQLGITDTRIKYTFLFFMLMSIRNKSTGLGVSVSNDKRYFIASMVLLVAFTIK